MSRVRANELTNKAADGSPSFPYGAVITGVVTATNFRKADGTEVGGIIAGINTAGVSTLTDLILEGDLTVQGTQTILNTQILDVEDKNIGIASVSTPSNTTADGGGITIYGGADGDKTLTWSSSSGKWAFSPGLDGLGVQTESVTVTNGNTASLNLSVQDHKVTATGSVTISCTGGTETDSHTIRIVNSGTATVGFSTYFLFPSGSTPVLPTADGAISLISFTVHRAGSVGVSTQLLSGASLNYS